MRNDLATKSRGGDDFVSAPAVALADEAGAQDDLETETGDGDLDGSTEVEVEHNGQTYRIPAALKPAMMMQADYTRKTQDLARHRRSLAEHADALQQQERSHQEHIGDVARVVALNDQLARFDGLDWNELQARDPAQAQELWNALLQIKDARDRSVALLQQNMQQKFLEGQRMRAKQVQDGHGVLVRELKGWSPELAARLRAHGQTFGFTPAELGQVTDPRLVKLLHAAFEGAAAKQRLAASEQAAAMENARPLPTVNGNGRTVRGLSDDQSVDEWMRRRNDQIRKKGR